MTSNHALALIALLAAAPAVAQDSQDPPPVEVEIVGGGVKSNISVAVPAMPGDAAIGRQIASVIASDLRSTGLFTPLGPNGIGSYSTAQAASPAYGCAWT